MITKPPLEQVFADWQQRFHTDARLDNFVEIERHIQYLDLACTPAAMLEGTALLLAATLAYLHTDGRDYESFIRQQHYRLGGEAMPCYCLTFDLGKGHYGRVLTDRTITEVDFADLFEHPWDPYRTAGFNAVHISRLDGDAIDSDEFDELYQRFTDDMFFDYSEEEVAASVYASELQDTVVATAVEH